MSSPPSSPASPGLPVPPAEKIRQLPDAAQAAYRAFAAGGDPASLDPLIFAVLEYYAPRKPERPLAELPGELRLMDDLGFDSLSITEIVFFIEDLFQISISNEEILTVRTLDDLRTFVRAKLAARPPS